MTEHANCRELALGVLLAVVKDGEYSHVALSSVLEKHQYLPRQDRAFLTRLCEGTLERAIELDYLLDQFSKTKTKDMKPAVLCILRMGAYQLKYMDSVPASAACNEAVKLAERRGFRNLKGFVNGVLRNVSRNLKSVTYPNENERPLYAWSVRYSVPEWMLAQWRADYGQKKAKSVAESLARETRTCVRVNRAKTTPGRLKEALNRRGIAAELAAFPDFPDFSDAMYISGYDYLSAIPEWEQGHFFAQDVCSMLAVHLADPKPGDYVIDVCAAPGGKSLHAAERMRGKGMAEARDLTEKKVALIEENIRRLGLKNIRAVQKDARVLDEDSRERADVVLADLPCSGLGTLRKKTDIRYRMTREKEESLVLLQREILGTACRYVKPGGTLLFSTCTMDRMENEENTAWFLAGHPQFYLEAERQFFPDEGEYDGFYIAKLIRKKH